MNFGRGFLAVTRKSILSFAPLLLILAAAFAPGHSAIAKPATWAQRADFVDLWDSDEPCALGASVYITLATGTQANVGFTDARHGIGYKSYPLKSAAPYILALDDESLPAPFLVINDEDHLEAWRAPGDASPVCVYTRED